MDNRTIWSTESNGRICTLLEMSDGSLVYREIYTSEKCVETCTVEKNGNEWGSWKNKTFFNGTCMATTVEDVPSNISLHGRKKIKEYLESKKK